MTADLGLHADLRNAYLAGLDVASLRQSHVFDRIARVARQHFGVLAAFVSLVFEDDVEIIGFDGLELTSIKRSDSLCEHVLRSREVFVVNDTIKDPVVRHKRVVIEEFGLRFYAGAPLIVHSDIRIGSVSVVDGTPRSDFTIGQKIVLQNVAEIAAAELERIRP